MNSSKFSLVSGLLAAKGDGALSVPEHSANEDFGGVTSRRVDVPVVEVTDEHLMLTCIESDFKLRSSVEDGRMNW